MRDIWCTERRTWQQAGAADLELRGSRVADRHRAGAIVRMAHVPKVLRARAQRPCQHLRAVRLAHTGLPGLHSDMHQRQHRLLC